MTEAPTYESEDAQLAMSLADRVDKLETGIRAVSGDVERIRLDLVKRTESFTQAGPVAEKDWSNKKIAVFGSIVAALTAAFTILYPIYAGHLDKDASQQISSVIAEQLQPTNEAVTKVQSDLVRLDTSVKAINDNVSLLLKKGLRVAASLPPVQFQKNLDVVASYASAAAQSATPFDEELSNAVRARLIMADKEAPFYWSAVGAFISQQSVASTMQSLSGIEKAPPCIPQESMSGQYVTCPPGTVVDIVDGTIHHNVFKDLIIRYRGGRATVINNVFINCTFVFFVDEAPRSAPIRTFMARLLALGPQREIKM